MYKKVKILLPLILSIALVLSAFPSTVFADSVVDLTGTLNITEGDSAVFVDTSAAIASGDFANGYVQMGTSTGSQYDQLTFQSSANPTAEGAISFSGSTVLLGDGSGTIGIGEIDSTYNGSNGQPLRVNFVTPMANSGFDNGSTGWTLYNDNYNISGDSINTTSDSYSVSVVQEASGNKYLHMSISGTTNSYGTGHGPTATSSYFDASPGDIITFDWKAARTSDYYDVYAFLINDATGQTFQILYQRGASISSWQTKQITLTSSYLTEYSDKLKFMFVCGSYDATGGRAVGSTMDIDNAQVVKSYATPEICQNILRQVKYQNTSDNPPASLDLIAQLKDKNGSVYSDSKPCYITPVNDAPVQAVNSQLTLNESGSAVISTSYLQATDVDDTPSGLTYTITTLPANGTITVGGSSVSTNGSFTQEQVDSGLVVYNHNGSKTTSDSFAFTMADGCEDGVAPISGTFSIDINSLPVVDTNEGLTVAEGASAAIGSSLLSSSDVDNTSSQLTYTITGTPSNGTLYKSGSAMSVGSTLTQTELESGVFSYTHNGGETTSDVFSFRLSDPASSLTDTFAISVTPVNDSPTVSINDTLSLLEGTESIVSSSLLNEGDPDDSGSGLVYTITSDTLNGGLYKNGSEIGAGSTFTQQDINDGLITYMHSGSQTTSDSFSFSLADGGEDSSSAYTGTFNISITAVNDPTVVSDQNYTVDENAANGTVVGTVVTYDEENDTRSFAITGGNTDGLFAISSAAGEITVAGTIDYDTVQQHVLTVTVTEYYESTSRTTTMTATIDVINKHDIPGTPSAPDLSSESDSGRDSQDNETNDNTPTVFGAAGSTMANTTIKIYIDNVFNGQTISGTDGAWSYTTAAITDGEHDITVTSTDLGGDVSGKSDALSILIDTSAPAANASMEPIFDGLTTDDRTPSFTGSGEAYSIVTVYDQDSKNYGTVYVDENGGFSFTVSADDALSIGDYEFTFTLTDISGNVSALSPVLSITVNDPPEAQDTDVTTNEDIPYVFVSDDFNYTDENNDAFTAVKITLLPAKGALKYFDGSNWQPAKANQEVLVSSINNGEFRYDPASDENGEDYTSFRFSVSDSIDYSYSSYTIAVSVTPVNDVQLFTGLGGAQINYLEDQGAALLDEAKTAKVTDIDNTELSDGTLKVSVSGNSHTDEDRLALSGGTSFTLSNGSNPGSIIKMSGAVVGAITNSGIGKDLVISLTSNATLGSIELLIYAVTYENMNTTDPALEARTIVFTLTDSDGQSATQSVQVSIERTGIPVVNTLAAYRSSIDANDATCSGKVLSDGKAAVTEVGIVYSTRSSFAPSEIEKMTAGKYTSPAGFSAALLKLPADTNIYYAAYALNSEGYGYGEVMKLRTHKLSDRNGDGILDNPSADTDGDGISDGKEQAAGSNPDDASSTPSDKDGDGKVDRTSADSDGDGVSDGDEQAAGSDPDDASSTPSDKDGDGKVDRTGADSDGDGVSDSDEQAAGSNPDDPSSTPSDKNGDGRVDRPSADSDGDGVSDSDEQAAGSNPDDASSTPSDKDGDGKVDRPLADSDGDGVSDDEEQEAGSNPDDPYSTPSDKNGDGRLDNPNADSDGDGVSDSDETAAGSDPDDPMSKPVAEGQAPVLRHAPAEAPSKPSADAAASFNVWQSQQGTTNTAIALGWDKVSGADYYLIWSGSNLIGTAYGTESCLISGLEPGTAYELRIGAFTMSSTRPASTDRLAGVADIAAATYGEDGLPLKDILSEYFGAGVSPVGGTRYDITGQITDENGVPIAGLTVELHSTPRTTVTDENGWYYFEEVETGEHKIYVLYNSSSSDVALRLVDENGTALAAETGIIYFDTSVSKTSTFVLNMSVTEEGSVSIERVESYPEVFSTSKANSAFGFIWAIPTGAAAILFLIFFMLFKRRRKQDEQEATA